jgi:phosphatidylglycerophosphate synthase
MLTHAIILVPEEQDHGLPPYLFKKVIGLPVLHRLIYSLWRAGIVRVSLLTAPEAAPSLEQDIAHISQTGGGAYQVYATWHALWSAAQDSQADSPVLVLTANVLATPKFLAEFARFPVPSGQLALAVTGPPESTAGAACRLNQPSYQAILEDNLVTSIELSSQPENPCALGLGLFSRSAWEGWQQWHLSQAWPEAAPPTDPHEALFPYIAEQTRKGKVIGVASDPHAVSIIHSDQDLKPAAVRLIAATEGSPWGEGFLESSVNRRLARKILLHLADSATQVNPNLITVSDLVIGLVAVAGFLTGTYWGSLIAALLLPLVIVLDTLDGLLARLTFQESRQGIVLDLYGDTILNLLIFYGIALGQYRATDQSLFLVLLIPLTLGYVWCWRLTDPLQGESQKKAAKLAPVGSKEFHSASEKAVNESASRDFFYLILLCALFNILDWFIIAVAVGANLFALFLYRRQRPGQMRPPLQP